MAKNAFAVGVLKAREEGHTEGVWEGVKLGLNLAAIALNRTYGFGDKRLTVVEAKVQELVNEMVDAGDPFVNKAHIEKAVRQIRRCE